MAEITIIKGQEFMIAVKEEIAREDLFFEQYRRAADMLDKIVESTIEVKNKDKSRSLKSQDFENNIIAFCGERGEGKSSAMLTFVNAVYADQKNDIFTHCSNLKDISFAEPILIDPSLFDDVHNVLDIVLAKIFRSFYNCYNNDNQSVDERTREKLLDSFQKVYRYVSLINNQKQMLDDEFDYEGNISKLMKLGESTNLKEELRELINDYLKIMGKSQLIIAIDDLDLCSANAYKMAEQIRKYLIIPQVCIVLSVKIEQLELCVREKNLKDFRAIYKNKDNEVIIQLNKEVQTMAERYVAKLIPRQRRIYLPKVQRFEDVRIIYREADSDRCIIDSWDIGGIDKSGNSNEKAEPNKPANKNRRFTLAMLDLIYERTGMRFLPEADGSSYLLPNNLRDMISWILMIAEMEELVEENADDKDKIYFENIVKLENYFVREWTGDNLKSYDGLTLQDIGSMDTFHLHTVVQRIMDKIYKEIYPAHVMPFQNFLTERLDTFFRVMGFFELFKKNVADTEKEAYVYRVRVLYTMRIHRLLRNGRYTELTDFFNGYIWGPSFYGLFPSHSKTKIDRSRFEIGTIVSYNSILSKISRTAAALQVPKIGEQYYVSRIVKGEERNCYIKAWIVLGLLSNIYYNSNNMLVFAFGEKLIAGNNRIWDYIQISLENYLVALLDMNMLYEKLNMQRLGIEIDEYRKIVDVCRNENQDSIHYARVIVSNMDLLIGLKDYCFTNRDYKENTLSNEDRTRRLVLNFFENIEKYFENYGIKIEADKLNRFILAKDQEIIISELYAELFVLSTEKNTDLVRDFRKKITELPESWSRVDKRANTSLRNLSVENVKNNLDRLGLGIESYIGKNKKQPDNLDVEGLCELYGSVIEMYSQDKNAKITPEMYEEYKRLVKVQNEMKAEAE